MKPLISVIIPVYNIEKYLRRCLDSVIDQTYDNLEIILIDDGSTDDSGAVCDEYSLKDERIIVAHKTNGGVSSARNHGLELAKGDYIGFVDGDDTIDPEMFGVLLTNAEKNSCGISCCGKDTITADGAAINSSCDNSRVISPEYALTHFFEEGFIKDLMYSVWNMLFSAECIDGLRFKDYRYGEDILFVFEAVMNCKSVYYDSFVGYHYMQRGDSAMKSSFSGSRLDYICAAREIEKSFSQAYKQHEDKAHIWVYRHVLTAMRSIIIHSMQNECKDFFDSEKQYLKENSKYLRQLPFKRRADYFGVMHFPLLIRSISSLRRHRK